MACRGSGVRVPSDPPKPLMSVKFSGVHFVGDRPWGPVGAFLGPHGSHRSTTDHDGRRTTRVCAALIRSMSTSVRFTYPPARFIEGLGDYLTVDELAEYLQLSKETI